MQIFNNAESQPRTFVASACVVENVDDALVVALADQAEHPQQGLELQRSTIFDPQDAGLTLDSYCIVNDEATYYGGLIWCELSREKLTLEFNTEAAEALKCSGYNITLQLGDAEFAALQQGLRDVFANAPEAAGWGL
jgi:hypothetical protein